MASTEVLAILSAFAVGMAALTAISVRWAAFARTPLAAGAVQFILVMMAGMFVGVLVYFAIGGDRGLVSGIWVAAAAMSASVTIVFLAFLREIRSEEPPNGAGRVRISRLGLVTSVVGLVLLNEFLMGWSFSLLSGALAPGLGPSLGDSLRILSEAITSPWFVFPMALEMLLTLRWLVRAVPSSMTPFLLVQPAVMVCSPPTFGALGWEVATAVAGSVLMAVVVAMYLVALFRDDPVPRSVRGYAVRLILSYGVMSAGLYLWVAYSSLELFALSLLVQMIVFLHASTDPVSYSAASDTGSGRDAVGELTVGTSRS